MVVFITINSHKNIMRTSSYFQYFGPGRIAISRSVPKNVLPGYKVFRDLAPGPWFREVNYAVYREKYFHQLSRLDPEKTWERLHDLADGYEPVLLCYERSPFSMRNWCHRRMVAEWFESELGFVVPEWSGSRESNPQLSLAIA